MNVSLAIVGFGEAGETFARAAAWGGTAKAFDIDIARRSVMLDAAVEPAPDMRAALADANVVLSLVTAGEALSAAAAAAPHLATGAVWLDMNSVAPDSKRKAAAIVEAAGGRYVDVAVLAPVDPAGLGVRLLVAGPHADAGYEALTSLGFRNVRTVGGEIGDASAIKMIRSVMIKGIEALTDEMMAAARIAGVEQEVIASLDASEKAIGWSERAAYNLERIEKHGIRRAEEMEQAVMTLRSLGVEPVMTAGTVRRIKAAAKPAAKTRDAA